MWRELCNYCATIAAETVVAWMPRVSRKQPWKRVNSAIHQLADEIPPQESVGRSETRRFFAEFRLCYQQPHSKYALKMLFITNEQAFCQIYQSVLLSISRITFPAFSIIFDCIFEGNVLLDASTSTATVSRRMFNGALYVWCYQFSNVENRFSRKHKVYFTFTIPLSGSYT